MHPDTTTAGRLATEAVEQQSPTTALAAIAEALIGLTATLDPTRDTYHPEEGRPTVQPDADAEPTPQQLEAAAQSAYAAWYMTGDGTYTEWSSIGPHTRARWHRVAAAALAAAGVRDDDGARWHRMADDQ